MSLFSIQEYLFFVKNAIPAYISKTAMQGKCIEIYSDPFLRFLFIVNNFFRMAYL